MNNRPLIVTKDQIKKAIALPQVIKSIEEGFPLYSQGKADIPPFGSLHFENPPGTVHIKHGHIKGDEVYVVKIASGFYNNPQLGIPSSQGLILVFNSNTGQLEAIMLDEAYLTEVRTGAAGAVAAKYLAPKDVFKIGIVGTGTQAFYQLLLLKDVIQCRDVMVWGRKRENFEILSLREELQEYNFQFTPDIKKLALSCNLIVTTTPARAPLLFAEDIQKGTHITAVGADGGGKQELDAMIFEKADVICVDSKSQCFNHGDTAYALKEGLIQPKNVLEIGELVMNPSLGRANAQQITIADLTGVAIQDIQIAKDVYRKFQGK
jgi:ornithine cyclodeaminase